ncbi:sugar-binding cellulase-like protein [Arenibacter algicola]|uniref:Sugar-binding cellulase-like protein n=1 Tax=Arenibacter algicola TaxID=616991 RepID=A0ABY3AGR7_9FLAO
MERRSFIKNTSVVLAGVSTLTTAGAFGCRKDEIRQSIPLTISKTEKPLAIAMWDFSWILRHHRYGEFENWEQVLSELAERGYNAIRMDAMPHFVVSAQEGKIINEFRSVKEDWKPSLWGNDYTMSFRPREALLEFLPLCKKYGIKVGLSTWFAPHNTGRTDIFNEEGGLLRAWSETLYFLRDNNLLDNVVYVDILNEYPVNHGYDWLKKELNKRSDIQQFKIDNPEAHMPDLDASKGNALQVAFHNQLMKDTIMALKGKFPELEFFTSYDSGVPLEDIDLSEQAALDYHVWFHHTGKILNIDKIGNRDQSQNLGILNKDLYSYWTDNKVQLINWVEDRIDNIALKAAKNNIVCGNTEGWGPIGWYDHPELDWRWTKESADICVDLALKHDNYKFICTSNFTHPQFKGIWEDVAWHRQITNRIKK